MSDAANSSPPPGFFVRLQAGGMVVVPPSQQSLVTYALLEHEDWFEKEIGFVRRLLQPGQQVLDIGADYGAYTVAMARAIGPTGRLIAFEPEGTVVAYLRETVGGNKLDQVVLRQAAPGQAGGATLDEEVQQAGLGPVDFVRLDAERTGLDILTGGTALFAKQSPLVMFTARQNGEPNAALLKAWRGLGYDIYRLIGPDSLLVPLSLDERLGVFEINLFACKPDHAEALEATALLAGNAAPPEHVVAGSGLTFWRQQTFASAFDHASGTADLRLVRALDLYAFWRDAARPSSQRYAALTEALGLLETVVAAKPTTAHISMLARLALEAGRRERALALIDQMMANERAKLPESPFWPVAPRYDGLRPGVDPGTWFAASLIEGFERLRAHSGYFAPQLPVDRLAWLSQTPFASAEMERRRLLLANRFGARQAIVPAPLVTKATPDNLNSDLWTALQGL